MDQRTLVVSCVEYYSDLKNIPSNKVFISFQQSGFIDLILDSHKTFPEMDIDFFVGMIGGLTYLESDAGEQEKEYTPHENRAAVGAEVVALLQKKHKMNDLEACEMNYNSQTAGLVIEDKTGWYQKPAQEIFEQIEAEKKMNGVEKKSAPFFIFPYVIFMRAEVGRQIIPDPEPPE